MSVLSGVYGHVAALRRARYARHPGRRRALHAPVISVGNLVVGGSGKTPVVAALARLLIAAGERPAILSRGYGRRGIAPPGVVVVSDGCASLVAPLVAPLVPTRESGDEPQMLARSLEGVPVLVCADRHLAGRLAEERLGATVHLLDDGFQHLPLARDVDLLLMAPGDLDERLLPSGRLREPLTAAAAADAVMVPGTAADAAAVAARLGAGTAFYLESHYGDLLRVEPLGAPLVPALDPPLTPRRVVAVAAIARPARFFTALAEGGWDVRREITFRDHHWFSPGDVARIEAIAREVDADLILTTEKDAVRLEGLVSGGPDKARPTGAADVHVVRTLSGPLWAYLPMTVGVEPAAAFREWLLARLDAARANRQAVSQ